MSISPLSTIGAHSAAQVADLAIAERAAPAGARTGAFNAASLRNAPAAEQRKAVAAQFEAILVRQLLGKTMTSMLGGEQAGVAGSVYGDMLADTMAQQLSAGQGLGLSRFLEQQLTPRGEPSADPGAASDDAKLQAPNS